MTACRKCQENNVESFVFPGHTCPGRASPMYVFRDDAGLLHQHNPAMETFFVCSMGHEWHETSYDPCPACGDDWITDVGKEGQ